jgi:hypothetical protein
MCYRRVWVEGTTLFTCEGEEPVRVECALGCQAGTSPRCARPVLSNGADITDLAGVPEVAFVVPRDRTYSIDTSSGRIVDDSGSVVRPTTGNGGVDDVTGSYFGFDDNGQALLAVHSLTVESGATLRGTGNRALIVLSRGAILIQGVVDVSGGCVGEDSSSRCGGPGGGDGGTVERGAGGCAPGGPGIGTPGGGLEQSESGGGGGGFGQAGAPGGLTGSEVTPRVGGVPGRPSAACPHRRSTSCAPFASAPTALSEVQSFVEKVLEGGDPAESWRAASDVRRVSVVEMRAFDGETTTTWARFVLLGDGTIRVVGKSDNDIRAADEMTARGVPGARGAIVTRDRGIEFLRLLAENFRGSAELATPVFEMDADAALVM